MSRPCATADVIAFLHGVPRFVPADEQRLHLDGHAVGWVRPAVAEALLGYDAARVRRDGEALHIRSEGDLAGRCALLQDWAVALKRDGLLLNWRDEAMQLDRDGAPFLIMERAAFRTLGLRTPSVHMNGWVAHPDGARLWVAQRSTHKFVDPGKLDNLVGGGLAAGESATVGLAREAWEEAGLAFRRAPEPRTRLFIHRRIGEGVQDECIQVHDVWLPAHWQPANQDGEVAGARLLALDEALPLLLAGEFTWDAGLVVLDGLLRQRHFGRDGTLAIETTLRQLGYRG